MRQSQRFLILAVVLIAGVGMASAATPAGVPAAPASAPQAATHAAHMHGKALHGTVSSVDQPAKSFVLKDADGKTFTLYWNAATRMMGTELKEGQPVSVRYMEQGGKNMATAMHVGPRERNHAPKKN